MEKNLVTLVSELDCYSYFSKNKIIIVYHEQIGGKYYDRRLAITNKMPNENTIYDDIIILPSKYYTQELDEVTYLYTYDAFETVLYRHEDTISQKFKSLEEFFAWLTRYAKNIKGEINNVF